MTVRKKKHRLRSARLGASQTDKQVFQAISFFLVVHAGSDVAHQQIFPISYLASIDHILFWVFFFLILIHRHQSWREGEAD